MKNNILFFILFIFLYGCYEDKGNYDYSEVNVIEIKEFQAHHDGWRLRLGSELELVPILTYSIDSTVTTLAYNWQIRLDPQNYVQLGTEKVLKWVADRAGQLTVLLTITDTTNGLQCIGEERIYVLDESEYPQGLWQILYEKNGKADLCALQVYNASYDPATGISTGACDYVDHVYSLENEGEELGGIPCSIHEIFADQNSRSHLLLLQKGGVGPVYLDGTSYKKTILLQEEFIGGKLPENVDFVNASYAPNGDILFTNTGEIYTRRKVYPEVFYSGTYPDFPVYYEGGMEITHMIKYNGWNAISTLMYDAKNHRFLVLVDGKEYYNEETGEWEDDPNAAAITSVYTEAASGFTPLNNMGNIDLKYIGVYGQLAGCFCWDLFKNNDDGEYYMQHFEYVSAPKVLKVVPGYQKKFPNPEVLNGENKFTMTPDERKYMFFSSTGSTTPGGIQDKLYGYQFEKGTGTVKWLYDFKGKNITSLCAGGKNAQHILAVGVDSGEMYFFKVEDSKIFAGGTIDYYAKTDPIFGKIVDVKYAYGESGSSPL